MRLIALAFVVLVPWVGAEDSEISQARFFRLLGIKPTEQDATPFGGLKTVVLTHKALVDKNKTEFADEEFRTCVLFLI